MIAAIVLASQMLYSPARGQSEWKLLKEIRDEHIRIVLPASADVAPREIQRIMEAFKHQAPLAGLPKEILVGKEITISLASEPRPGLYAWNAARVGLIVLPLDEAPAWEASKLYRIVRHELAHVGLGVFLAYAEVPEWFAEGFAEWVAGGLSVEGEARIELYLLSRRIRGERPPRVFGAGVPTRPRLLYDLYVSFFEFVEERQPGVVESGALLRGVRVNGVRSGVRDVLNADLAELEREWQSYLMERYGSLAKATRERSH